MAKIVMGTRSPWLSDLLIKRIREKIESTDGLTGNFFNLGCRTTRPDEETLASKVEVEGKSFPIIVTNILEKDNVISLTVIPDSENTKYFHSLFSKVGGHFEPWLNKEQEVGIVGMDLYFYVRGAIDV